MGKVTLIAAMDRIGGIGMGGMLPWHLPDDLAHFAHETIGKHVLMGRKTSESIGRVLPGRVNLVLTRGGKSPIAGMTPVLSIDEAVAIAGDGELMVIGGGEVYQQAIGIADEMILTLVHANVKADAFFPRFGDEWVDGGSMTYGADECNEYRFTIVRMTRRV